MELESYSKNAYRFLVHSRVDWLNSFLIKGLRRAFHHQPKTAMTPPFGRAGGPYLFVPSAHPALGRSAWVVVCFGLLAFPPISGQQAPVNPFQAGPGAPAEPTLPQIHKLSQAVKESPQSFSARMDLGIALAQSTRWQPALEQFDAAHRIKPDSPEAIYDQGLTFLMMAGANADRGSLTYYEQLHSAQQALVRALEMDPQLPKIHEHLGRLYHLIGDPDSATQQFRMEVELNPTSFEALNNLGTSLGETANYAEAIDCYEKALALDLKCASCVLNLESAIRRQGATTTALKKYEALAQNQPDSPLAQLLYGMILTAFADQRDLAITELRSALHAVPDLAAAHFYLGQLEHQKRDNAAAEADYRLAMEMAPGRSEILGSLAEVLLQENKAKDAEAVLQKALLLDPGNAALHYKFSVALKQTGETSKAAHERAETARLEKLDQSRSQLEMNLRNGIADLRSGNASKAVGELQVALSLDPNHPETNYYLGIALSQTGDSAESSEAFKRALERRPESAEFHYNFGIALWQSGQSSSAIEQFRRATAIRPDDALAHCALGIALLRTGDPEEGQKEISRAQQMGACAAPKH
jgi:Flp pilus assembly protein TadD